MKYLPLIQMDNLLSEHESVFILRRSNETFENTFYELNNQIILREDAITPLDVPNMSMNLIGGSFREKFLRFIPKMRTAGVQKWDGSKRVYLSEFLDFYSITKSYSPVYFNAQKIHRITFPYNQNKTKELSRLLSGLGESPVEENDKYKLQGYTEVCHDPINLNYWHIEFKVIDFKGDVIPRKNAAWIEALSKQTIKNILSVNSYPTIPNDITAISLKNYLRK